MKTKDVRMHSSEQRENTQVDFKAENNLRTASENVSSRQGWKSSMCHKVPLLPLADLEDPCKGGEEQWGHGSPGQISGVLELLLIKMGVKSTHKNPTPNWSMLSFRSGNMPAQYSI